MTRTIGGGVVVVGLVFACATMASAQDQNPALTMAYPAAVGVLLPVGGSWAVRPELSFSTQSLDLPVPSGSSDSTSVSTGVSLLYYLHEADGLRTYVSPRVTYQRTSLDAGSGISSLDTTTSFWGFIGSFGAQYALGRRFGVFGEVGIGYQKGTTSSSQLLGDQHTHQVGTRAGVGVLLNW
jgi:hypothetical protein